MCEKDLFSIFLLNTFDISMMYNSFLEDLCALIRA